MGILSMGGGKVIEGRSLSSKKAPLDEEVEMLLEIYRRLVVSSKGELLGHQFEYASNHALSDCTPSERSVSKLASILTHHRMDVFSGTHLIRGYEPLFVSRCMQRSYHCGFNNFTWDATDWGEDTMSIPYRISGIEGNPLSFAVIGDIGDHSLSQLKYCTAYVHGSVGQNFGLAGVYNSEVHIFDNVFLDLLADCKHSSFYFHNPQECDTLLDRGVINCTFYVPENYVEQLQELYADCELRVGKKFNNIILSLPEEEC